MIRFIHWVQRELRNYPQDPINSACTTVSRKLKELVYIVGNTPGVARVPVALRLLGYLCATPVTVVSTVDLAIRSLARQVLGVPRRFPCMHEIIPGVYLGNIDAAANVDFLRRQGIDAVLSLYPHGPKYPASINYLGFAIKDEPEADLLAILDDALKFLDAQRSDGRRVLVHCHQGNSRSASIVIAYLIRYRGLTYEQALALTQRARSTVRPNPGFRETLKLEAVGPRYSPTPVDWENLRLAVQRPTNSRKLRAIDGLFHKSVYNRNEEALNNCFTLALDRIGMLPWDLLTGQEKNLLCRVVRVLDRQGEKCWFWSHKDHHVLRSVRKYAPPITATALPSSGEDHRPAATSWLRLPYRHGDAPREHLEHWLVNQRPEHRSEHLAIYWPHGRTCVVQFGGVEFLFDPNFRHGLLHSPIKVHELLPDVVLFPGEQTWGRSTREALTALDPVILNPHSAPSIAVQSQHATVTVTSLKEGSWALESNGRTLLYLTRPLLEYAQTYSNPSMIILADPLQAISVVDAFNPRRLIPIGWDGNLGRDGDGQEIVRLQAALGARVDIWGKIYLPHMGEWISKGCYIFNDAGWKGGVGPQ